MLIEIFLLTADDTEQVFERCRLGLYRDILVTILPYAAPLSHLLQVIAFSQCCSAPSV